MSEFFTILWWLLMAHAFTDYIWQSPEMGKYKQPDSNPPSNYGPWYWHMIAHGLINAAGVNFVTGSVWLGVGEFLVHISLDYSKCRGWCSAWDDQIGHLLSKVAWALCLVLVQ